MLPILGVEDHNLNDDEECAARQMIRHVCVALKRYMESHLFFKYTQLSRLNEPSTQSTNVVQVLRVSLFSQHFDFVICNMKAIDKIIDIDLMAFILI